MAHAEPTAAERNGTAVAALLADPRLAKYLHRDTAPARFPLQIVDAAGAGIALPPGTADAVVVPAGAVPDPARAALVLGEVRLGDTTARLVFTLAIEGIAGDAALTAAGAGWTVERLHIVER